MCGDRPGSVLSQTCEKLSQICDKTPADRFCSAQKTLDRCRRRLTVVFWQLHSTKTDRRLSSGDCSQPKPIDGCLPAIALNKGRLTVVFQQLHSTKTDRRLSSGDCSQPRPMDSCLP